MNKYDQLPSDGSSIGSNSPSAHVSMFHDAFEFVFELIGLVMICLVDRLGKSFG